MVINAINFFFGLLLVSPDVNVSLNPGFEAFIGVSNHGKEDDDIICTDCSDKLVSSCVAMIRKSGWEACTATRELELGEMCFHPPSQYFGSTYCTTPPSPATGPSRPSASTSPAPSGPVYTAKKKIEVLKFRTFITY
jgi:hypothetical protein